MEGDVGAGKGAGRPGGPWSGPQVGAQAQGQFFSGAFFRNKRVFSLLDFNF